MRTRFFSTEGFGRKLLIFLLVDAVVATIQGISSGNPASAFGKFLLGSFGSVFLAAIWQASERDR